MNNHTAKLIRRFSVQMGFSERAVKRSWNAMPWPQRAKLRTDMDRAVISLREAIKEGIQP